MNQKKAKRIRKKIYGDFSPRVRTYTRDEKTGAIIADHRRRAYQKAKKD